MDIGLSRREAAEACYDYQAEEALDEKMVHAPGSTREGSHFTMLHSTCSRLRVRLGHTAGSWGLSPIFSVGD